MLSRPGKFSSDPNFRVKIILGSTHFSILSRGAVLRVLVGVPFEHQLPVGLFDGRLTNIRLDYRLSSGVVHVSFSPGFSPKNYHPQKKTTNIYQQDRTFTVYHSIFVHLCFIIIYTIWLFNIAMENHHFFHG